MTVQNLLGHTGNSKKFDLLPLLGKVASNGGEFCFTMFNAWEFCSLSLPWFCLILKENENFKRINSKIVG